MRMIGIDTNGIGEQWEWFINNDGSGVGMR